METNQKTIDEIIIAYPGLELVEEGGFYFVGYPQPGDLFKTMGTGFTANEAWQEAYEFLTNTGRYSYEVGISSLFEIRLEVTPDKQHWLYFYSTSGVCTKALDISEVRAKDLSKSLKISINEFPF